MARIRRAGTPRAMTALRSHKEVAEIMTQRGIKMSKSRVEQLEHRALAKLRDVLAELASDFAGGTS